MTRATEFAMGALLLASALAGCGRSAPAAPVSAALAARSIAANGVIEPAGEERVLIPEVGGRLAHVYIAEGDRVTAGQVLAEIASAEYEGAAAAAAAALAARQAELDKLEHGARPEERRQARAALDEAMAADAVAASEYERRRKMWDSRQVSREIVEQSENAAKAAGARRAAAQAGYDLIEHGARAEDLAAARAALAEAQGQVERTKALVEKTRIRSPIDGVVLKRDLREGETVVALSPIPLARIGDLSRLYVRAEVDELDVARVAVGQRARVTADGYPGRSFPGTVESISRRMGRRSLSSDDPTRKTDTQVLETRILLDPGASIPVGLRVDVRIDLDGATPSH